MQTCLISATSSCRMSSGTYQVKQQRACLLIAPTAAAGALDAKDNDGMTALAHAVQNGMDDVVPRLLEAGASVEVQAYRKNTLVHMAAMNDGDANVKILKLFVDSKFDLEAVNEVRGVEAGTLLAWTDTESYCLLVTFWPMPMISPCLSSPFSAVPSAHASTALDDLITNSCAHFTGFADTGPSRCCDRITSSVAVPR